MQYDVRRSDPKTGKQAEPGKAAEPPNNAPLLRERLIDVVRRDRAIAAIAVAQHEGQRDAVPAPKPAQGDPRLDPEAKSGTHARMPGVTPPFEAGQTIAEERISFSDGLHSISAEPLLLTEPSWAEQAARADQAFEAEQRVSLIASWIEEEIIEIDESSDMPIIFIPEPPPLPAAALARSIKPTFDSESSDPKAVERGLELILEADAELPRQEPIRTRTMARLLAGHGYAGRALSIYDHLITRDPNDASLRAEADALRARK